MKSICWQKKKNWAICWNKPSDRRSVLDHVREIVFVNFATSLSVQEIGFPVHRIFIASRTGAHGAMGIKYALSRLTNNWQNMLIKDSRYSGCHTFP
jgi:hypothetical protein